MKKMQELAAPGPEHKVLASMVGEWEAEARAKGYRGRRVRISYEGPLVIYPSHDAFCDLELGLAGESR